MPYIPPMHVREKYFRPIEDEIQRLFNELIYIPLLRIALRRNPDEIMNSLRALVSAVQQGRVWYEDGQFKGSFNAAISKELRTLGAQWNPAAKTWSLTKQDLPVEVQFAQATADQRYEAIRRDMLTTMADMDISMIDNNSDLISKYGKAIDQMEMDFRKSVTGIEAITIVPKLTEGQRKIIAEQWAQNLNLYIKNWTQENILKLRQQIQDNTFSGAGRAEAMVKTIQENYGSSKAKAKFLARQETALLMSKFQETRYGDMGINKYRWSTSHDERVRPDHAALNGKVFLFDQPPVTDRRTGARNNPGQDFNCRCIAIPILD